MVLGAQDGETELGIVDIVLFEDAEYEMSQVSKAEFKAQLDALVD